MKKYLNFEHIDIDANIGRSKGMRELIKSVPGEDEVRKMGNLFGTPWTNPEIYKKKEAIYLEIEKMEMRKCFDTLGSYSKNLIVDFTGSSVYCHEELELFQGKGFFVYFEAGKEAYEKMQEKFLSDPKPVIWGDNLLEKWIKAHGEYGDACKDDLPELYQKLLDDRHKLYGERADVILKWDEHRELLNPDKPRDFFDLINTKIHL